MSSATHGRVVLVDTDEPLLETYRESLITAGFEVDTFTSSAVFVRGFRADTADVVVLEIGLPELDGFAALSEVRKIDPDVPVLLITGKPTIDSAIAAIESGALRYLVKPLAAPQLVAAATEATRLCKLARLRREATRVAKSIPPGPGRSSLRESFENALSTLYMAYQPILDVQSREVFGYEALVRAREASIPHAGALFDTAEKLGTLGELTRKIRDIAPRALTEIAQQEALFINLHPYELADEKFVDEVELLRPIADRVVFEMSERSSIDDLGQYRTRIAKLREYGFRIAVDDLGAGYAGLTSFALLEPDIVKLDMTLVRNVEQSSIKKKLIASLVSLCAEMRVRVIAEGVETPEESATLTEIGCSLQQGYLHGRPAFPLTPPK